LQILIANAEYRQRAALIFVPFNYAFFFTKQKSRSKRHANITSFIVYQWPSAMYQLIMRNQLTTNLLVNQSALI